MNYVSKPIKIKAHQFYLDMPLPDWLEEMKLLGALYTYGPNQKSKMPVYASIENKRGKYKAFEGDWICLDKFGHVFVVSYKTFAARFSLIHNS